MCNIIREMAADDYEAVIAIINSHDTDDAKAAAKYFQNYLKCTEARRKHHRNYVAVVDDNKVVGVSGFYIDIEAKGTYWLNWTYVSPDHQRRGIGSALFAAIENEVCCLGARKLYVDTSNHPIYQGSLNFYEKKGLKREAILKDYYEDGEDQLILGKRL